MCLMVVLALAMFGAAVARPGYDQDYDVSSCDVERINYYQ